MRNRSQTDNIYHFALQGVTFPHDTIDESSCHLLIDMSYETNIIFFLLIGELFQVLKMMVGSNLKDSQLQQIVDKVSMIILFFLKVIFIKIK